MSDSLSDPTNLMVKGERLRANWLPDLALLAGFALLAMLLTMVAAISIHAGGTEGLFLALVLALLIGLTIVLAAGFDGWLPAIFALSLLAALNLTVERIP